jgi:hypothetical protein
MSTSSKRLKYNSKETNNQTEEIMLTIEELKDIFQEHLWIKTTEENIEEAEATTRYYANQTGRNYALVNYICVKSLASWFKEYQGIGSNYQVFSSEYNLARMWQFINGSAININDKRLILIPSNSTDLESFQVEQELVDVPNLAGDYYLPVRVDLEINCLHIWGFISRENLKKTADYDDFEKLYIVDGGNVIDNLETLWISLELCEEKGDFQPLPTLTQSEAETLIQTYCEPSSYSPRLRGNFQEWMALLNKEEWLKKLDLEALIKSPDRPLVIFLDQLYQRSPAEIRTKPNVEKQEEAIYRSDLPIPSKLGQYPRFPINGVILSTPENIDRAIKNLLAKSVKEVVPANLEPEDILLDLLLNGKQDISGQAAEIFWAIASCFPSSKTKGIHTKKIEISGHLLVANIAFIQVPSGKIAILLRVHSESSNFLLPNGLTLQWMFPDAQGNYIPSGTPEVANKQNCIQLYFRADFGNNYTYQIKLGHKISEQKFIV